MPRKKSVDQHPQKHEVIAALVEGRTYRDISAQYGLSSTALGEYLRKELAKKTALANRETDILDGNFVLDNAAKAALSLRKMLEACTRYLQSPDDPQAFDVGPRADEVDVVLQHHNEDGSPSHTERRTLQQFIDAIEQQSTGVVREVKYNHEDPRRLVISTANAINRQLGVLAKIQEQAIGMARDNETRQSVVESETWAQMADAMIDATQNCPEARRKIATALDRIKATTTGS